MGGQKDQIAGKAKELQGRLTGDTERETEGRTQHAIGKVEKRAEDVVDRAKGAAEAAKDKVGGR